MTRARQMASLINTYQLVGGGVAIGGSTTINGPTTIPADNGANIFTAVDLSNIYYPAFLQAGERFFKDTTTTSGLLQQPYQGSVTYLTANQAANRTYNARYFSIMPTSKGDNIEDVVISHAVLFTNGATPYVINDVTSDGVFDHTITLKWQGGAAPTAGNANSVDLYTFTFVRTGTLAYTCFASQPVKYA
jgi:hypothetical protein